MKKDKATFVVNAASYWQNITGKYTFRQLTLLPHNQTLFAIRISVIKYLEPSILL